MASNLSIYLGRGLWFINHCIDHLVVNLYCLAQVSVAAPAKGKLARTGK